MAWHEFRIRQDGRTVAKAGGPDAARAENEILHYAMQYRQDGPVKIERQQRCAAPNPDGKWYWKRHMFLEQWPPQEDDACASKR